MALRLLVIQLSISFFWLAFVVSDLNPITLPLVASFALMPLIGVISTAKLPLIRVIPMFVLFIVGYLAWMYGWEPQGPAFAWVSGLVFLIAWMECTQSSEHTDMPSIWLGLVLYSPLLIMGAADVAEIDSAWPAAIGIAIQSGALVFALRNEWPTTTAFTDVTLSRMNGLAMLLVPVIYITDPTAIFGTHEHILGIGGAISAIVMTRQQLRNRRTLMATNQVLTNYAYHDQLTGVYTWAGLLAHLKAHAITDVTMVCVDIDGFGEINAQRGLHAGDNVLIALSNQFPRVLPQAVAARIGGDFFVFVVPSPTVDLEEIEAAFTTMGRAIDPALALTATAGVSPFAPVSQLTDRLSVCDQDIAARRRARRAAMATAA